MNGSTGNDDLQAKRDAFEKKLKGMDTASIIKKLEALPASNPILARLEARYRRIAAHGWEQGAAWARDTATLEQLKRLRKAQAARRDFFDPANERVLLHPAEEFFRTIELRRPAAEANGFWFSELNVQIPDECLDTGNGEEVDRDFVSDISDLTSEFIDGFVEGALAVNRGDTPPES